MSGTPFAANPLAGLYYPLNWPLLFAPWLPLAVGFNLSAWVHLSLAGATMFALMRHGFGTGRWGALLAAAAYEASAKLLGHLGAGHVGWVQAWAWLPLVMLCVTKLCTSATRGAGRWAVAAGAALAVQFCADVRMSAYALIAAATLLLTRALCQPASRGREARPTPGSETLNLGLFIVPFAVFLGLSACQWLPALALLPQTTRSSMTLIDAAVWSLPWRYLSGLLLADHGGFHEWMTYIGVGTLVFAAKGTWCLWRDRDRPLECRAAGVGGWLGVWLVGLAVFATWFSLGTNGGLFQALWRIVPGLGLLRVPPRAWVLVVFAIAVLAGLGVEEARAQGGRRTRRVTRWKRPLLVAAATAPVMLVVGYWLSSGDLPLNLAMFGIVAPLAIALSSGQHQARDRQWLRIAAVLLVALDLLIVDFTLIKARSPEHVFSDGQAVARWLTEQPGRFRVYSPSYSLPQHIAEQHDLQLADGVDPLQLRAYADYLTRAAGLEPRPRYSVTLPPFPPGSDVRTALEDVYPNAVMLGQLGARYLVAAFPLDLDSGTTADRWQRVGGFDGPYVYRNLDARPLPDTASDTSISLADGSLLFQYDPWPVYAGWAVSGATLLAVIAWAAGRSWTKEDG